MMACSKSENGVTVTSIKTGGIGQGSGISQKNEYYKYMYI